MTEATLLEQLQHERRKLADQRYELIAAREQLRQEFERSNPTEVQIKEVHADEARHAERRQKLDAQIDALDSRISDQKIVEKRRAAAAKATSGITVTSEPLTYRRDNSAKVSYFKDLAITRNPAARAQVRSTTPEEAQARLDAHAREAAVEMPRRAAAAEARALRAVERAEKKFRASVPAYAQRQLDRMDFNPFAVEQRITPNRTDGYGGFFVPPFWVNDYIKGLRPGRTTANRCTRMDLPQGTDVIVVPKLANLTSVGIQGGDNAPVQESDWSDTAVTAPIKTLAGMSDISLQLLEQSPYEVDRMIIQDLLADYDKQLDLQICGGSGTVSNSITPTVGGQVAGFYSSAGASNWSNANTVTYTTGSPLPWHMFSLFGAMQSKIAENRFLFDDSMSFVMHPRRAWWLASGLDSQNRPLFESRSFGPFNVMAVSPDSVPAEGQIAQLPWGTRLFADANITTADTAGGGSAQDIALGFLGSDAWLFEGQMHTDTFDQVLSGTLAIRFRVYAYVGFLLRYGQSLAIASGSGFSAPTGAVTSITF